ncbi:hemicentin-2 isoform X3 [Vespula squamosa]|uniref:Hemicentin-2 isoform X3 n=1 Tax=Vespula squamosa TaxID=30214 RepID=A0ABD2BEB6_VESSQ
MANSTFVSSINERSQKFHYVCELSNAPDRWYHRPLTHQNSSGEEFAERSHRMHRMNIIKVASCNAYEAGEQLFLKPDRLATLKHPSKIEKPPQYTTFKPGN